MPYRSLKKRVGNAVRLAEVLQVLARHGFADLLRRLRVHESLPAKALRRLRIMEAPVGEPETLGSRLRAALTELGPTFVKIGQILSTRPDVIGMDLCTELGRLQDRVTPLPFEKMRPVIESSLGGSLTDHFAEFQSEPIASASLSQVYRATLQNGKPVAVKVQRPGIRQVIESDFELLRGFGEWATEHVEELEWLNPAGMVDQLERSIRRELDFTVEARTIERFRNNYEEIHHVFVPRTYREHSSSYVLTMDWIDGVRVDALEEYAARNCDARAVAIAGCETLCKQVFEDQLFHADPHPGNILVTRNNQIAFLDYGMVGHLERADVMAMADLLRAVFNEDTEGCVEALLMFTVPGELEDPQALEHDLAEYIAFDAQAVIGGGQVGKALELVFAILQRHHLQLAPRLSLLLKALATIESTGHSLDPDLDMVPIIRPHVERIVAKRFAPSQLLQDARHDVAGLLRLAREFPSDLLQLARMFRRGRFKIQLHHEKLDHIAAVTDRASNRVTFGVITGSIIVGSSLLISADTGAKPLGLAGYIVAGVLGLALMVSILRSRNF